MSLYKDRKELEELEYKLALGSVTQDEQKRMSFLTCVIEDAEYEARQIAAEDAEDRFYYEDER
jgi:hypothetical protein